MSEYQKFCTNRLDSPKGMQEHLRMEGVDMSLSGTRKGLKKRGFNAKRKIKTNFVSKDNKAERYAWAKKYRNYTLIDWRQWVISDETKVNMWGTDGNYFVWSDRDNILLPHQMEPHVQGFGGGVMFWSCITATGPGYGTTLINCSIYSSVYVDILETASLDTLNYFDLHIKDIRFQLDRATSHTSVITKQWFNEHGFSVDTIMNWPTRSPDLNPIVHVWYPLKRRPNAFFTRTTTKEELEQRIAIKWYKLTEKGCLKYIDSMPVRIKATIKSKGGPTKYQTFL
ncbi:hypothetical protein INT46_010489 [Mucor plumbeus]|uniref:Tc1-like transposase DDE domain-containing protein n=1 Tax=Mucor plumbeus TaxID=97098 RepID=A0A8H7R9B9_9FUNG|nr:hypothetical protein INT46_010489 [Mucor plumbeus]